ncbi:OmpA family protein [Aestuariicella sp. G3-2]|uniref:flagellar protein MotY n=1 Tax=Pseudomaricurvus albidus TaxID=2842452 RepID=UPI001C0DED0A|nr:OmpA family protein [Aestuariicella albida]MBU3070123.1 OmpA family protein [Aestuariicella albida]
MSGCGGFRRGMQWMALLMLALQPLVVAASGAFKAGLDDASWLVDSSIYDCRMSHEVPYYGYAVFEQEAGEAAQFHLVPGTPRLKPGKAALMSAPPVWKPNGQTKEMGWVTISQGERPVTVKGAVFQRLLSELLAGQELSFTRMPWYGAEQSAQVVLSPVNFRQAYHKYQECLADLLPVNFEQIRRTAIYFPSGSDELKPGEITKLDNIALYVNADDRVGSFYVDGHTDSAGHRSDNLELSRRRAEVVVALLVERGVSAEKITTRWHGERYPVATNRNVQGRDQNRRVTIRIEKVGYVETLPPQIEKNDVESLDTETLSSAPVMNGKPSGEEPGQHSQKEGTASEPSLASVSSF